jgi:hypothetical protein
MSYSDKAFAQLVEIAGSLSAAQRRFLAAMAGGAQVLQVYPGHAYSAWKEREDGKIVEVCKGLSVNDFRSMRLLMPMVAKGANATWGAEFFYIPAASRLAATDALILTQPIPEELKFRLEHAQSIAAAAESIEPAEPPVRVRMAA